VCLAAQDENARVPDFETELTMDLVHEQLDAYNGRDLERFLACYASDTVIEDGDGACLMEGIDALRSRHGALFAQSPELHAEVVARMRVGDYVVDEEHVSGADLPGRPAEFKLVAIYRVRDGRIAHVRMLR
jgi:hypothetical protein